MVRILILTTVLLSTSFVSAATLFEGYYKILANSKHVGYTIARYSFDEKKSQFKSTTFLKVGKDATEMTESLTAVSDSNLNPISYEYTNIMGKVVKTIDAKFIKGTLRATIKENGKISKIDKKIENGTILSNFLVILILKGKDGLKENSNYQYQAIAEEDAISVKATAASGKRETFRGLQAIKINNTFKGAEFTSWVTDKGEVLGTESKSSGIETVLVANPNEATDGQIFSQGIIKTLFGEIPAGIGNAISAMTPQAPSKEMGVPQGNGILLKANSKGQDK